MFHFNMRASWDAFLSLRIWFWYIQTPWIFQLQERFSAGQSNATQQGQFSARGKKHEHHSWVPLGLNWARTHTGYSHTPARRQLQLHISNFQNATSTCHFQKCYKNDVQWAYYSFQYATRICDLPLLTNAFSSRFSKNTVLNSLPHKHCALKNKEKNSKTTHKNKKDQPPEEKAQHDLKRDYGGEVISHFL